MKICKIGDICNVNPSSYSDNEGWSYAYYLDTSNITENVINTIQYFDLKKEKLPSRARRIVEMGDIIYSTVRPDQRHYGFITHTHRNFLVSTGFTTIRAKEDVCDSKYLYYFLTQEKIILYLQSLAEQAVSTFPSIRSKDIEELIIPLPPLPVQKKIAAILSSLDDKIEINTRMNKVLEETARALFHRWFVEFEFPNDAGKPYKSSGGRMIASEMGEIPEGWRVGTLKELITIIGGGTPKTSIKEYWTGTIPWFSVVDAPKEGDIFVLDTEKHVSELGIENSSTQILPLGTTIISARGTVGKIAMVGTPMAMNQSCYGIKGKDAGTDIYIYYLISNMVGTLQKQGHGSVFNTITRDTINNQQVVIPDIEIRSTFDQAQLPLFQQIKTNLQQSDALKKIRDTLLPKLLCGEL